MPAQAAPAPRDLFVENESPMKFEETVEALKSEMTAGGWSILATHNLSAKLAEKGHNVLPVAIIEGCSGKFSVVLLKNEQTRYVSSMLPCRLAVYETSTGKVIISRMNTQIMGAQMEPAVAEIMTKASDSIEAIIAKVLAKK
ncbi:MAG: DUF302 domain-containing protein [Gallionellaceae bacterium]|nr:DUF302 domain-containing protein [Gallionellaceae bacterium]